MATKDFEWLEIGRDGNEHIRALKELAIAAGMEVPIYTCTGWGGASFLEEETLPLYGGYSFCPWVVNEGEVHAPTNEYLIQSFHDNNSSCVEFKPPYQPEKYPYACCELGGGMACWYKYRFVVEPESVEAATIIKIAGGCNFIGYYMFRDGSNPVGKKGFLNERSVPKISYNFQAPLGEYGQIRDSYKMLKPLFYFLKEAQATLCPMGTVLPQEVKNLRPDNNKTLRYAVRHSDSAGFIFLVNYQDHYEMKNIEDIRLKIRTQEEVIAIPRQGRGITLKKNVSAILPFNMKLEGINLRYSTTQFITSIFYQNIRTYFFFEVEGMESEYCFNASDVADIHATGGAINQDRDVIDVFVQPSLESVIEMVSVYGDKVRICTFNRTQAVNFWKFNVWGQDRVIISQEDILFREGQLEVIMDGNKTADLYLYPPVDELLRTEQEVLISERTGIFDTISIASPAKDIKLKVKKFEKNGCNVEFPEDIFSDADDVIMKIDYWGNVGNAFVDGILVSDNFCNGRPWEIGLKWIQANLLKNGMYLHIIPLKKDSEVIFDSSVKFAQHDITHEISEIHSITAIPRYNIKIYMEGTYYEEN